MDGNGQQGNGQMGLTQLQQYKAGLQTQSEQLYGWIRRLKNQNVNIWDQAVAYYNMRQQYFASLCNLPQQPYEVQCNWWALQEQQMAASCTQVLEIANYIDNYNLCQSQIQQQIAAVDIQILYIEQQASDKPNTTQAEVQIHPDVVEVVDLNQITAATDQACQKNPETTKSATERIRDLPVYTALQDLQAAVKEIFKDCTITVGGKQQSVSSYFDRFNPNHDSVVFWSECQQPKNPITIEIDKVIINVPVIKNNDVAVMIAEKINSTTLSMTRGDKHNGGIKLCRFGFEKDTNININTEFDVESSFLAAQQFKKAYFISNEGTTAGEVWTNYELPLLLRNPSVEQIIRIDATVYNDIKDLHQEKIKSAIDQKSLIVFDRDPYCKANTHFATDPGAINNLCEQILNIKSVVPSQSTQRDDQSAGLE